MKQIYKYAIHLGEICNEPYAINMPLGAEVLSVQNQDGQLCIWVLVEPRAPLIPRRFTIVGTGHEFRVEGKFVGTVQFFQGSFVVHVFEVA